MRKLIWILPLIFCLSCGEKEPRFTYNPERFEEQINKVTTNPDLRSDVVALNQQFVKMGLMYQIETDPATKDQIRQLILRMFPAESEVYLIPDFRDFRDRLEQSY